MPAPRLMASAADATPFQPLTPSAKAADTIFALSSGAGVRAGVSVIRISGPQARHVILRMAPGRNGVLPEPRRAALRSLRKPPPFESTAATIDGAAVASTGEAQEVIDRALVLWFPGPKSFTGEDTVELHTHGSRAVVSATLQALGEIEGCRLAERGEFSRQAFSNGQMDLMEVEGLADLINADTEQQRKQALAQMEGVQRRQYEAWRKQLLTCLAHTEALIDFGDDEEDVTAAALEGALTKTRLVGEQMQAALTDGERGEAVREGVRVAILGPPNAGKSSLLNLLAQRDAAIVSPVAGTTRDVVTVSLSLGGLPVILSDTAGLRADTNDPIEQMGMQRSAREAARAHLQLWVFDAAEPPLTEDSVDAAAAAAAATEAVGGAHDEGSDDGSAEGAQAAPARLLILNKVDLRESAPASSPLFAEENQWSLSCRTQQGVDDFLEALGAMVRKSYGADEREPALVTRARHREHLLRCVAALETFERLAAMGEGAPLDLATEELRYAANEIGRITGKIDVEELLDVIFRDFCIGK